MLCGVTYDQRRLGSLDCWCHPLPYDSNIGYYPCCGQSLDRSDAAHCTLSIDGCTKIDHVSTPIELQRVKTSPYTLIPMRYAKSIDAIRILSKRFPLESISIEQRVIPVKEKTDLEKTYVLKTFTDFIVLSFEELSKIVENGDYELRITELSDEEKDIEDESITNFFHYSHREVDWEEDEKFEKFFILRRMEFDPTMSRIQFGKQLGNIERYSRLKRKREQMRRVLVSEDIEEE